MRSPSDEASGPGSRRLRLGGAAGLALAALLVWTAAYQARFTSLWYPDACDYAQLGRQIVESEGLTSQQSFPYVLSWFRAHGFATEPPWPNVTRFVLPPLERAASFSMFGVSDLAALLPDALFFAATVALSFSLAARLAGPLAGWSAAVLVVLSPTMHHYALSGLSETGAGFFLLVIGSSLAAMAAPPTRDGKDPYRQAAWLGLWLGLGFLQRSNLAFGLVPVAWILLRRVDRYPVRTRFQLLATCSAVVAFVSLPWLVRNWAAFGSPMFSLTVDRNVAMALVGRDPFDDFALVESGRIIAEHMQGVLAHLHPAWLIEHWRELFGEDLRMFVPALLATALLPFTIEGRALRLYVWVVVLLTWVVTAPLVIHTHARQYTPFAPVVVVLVVSGVVSLLARVHRTAGPLAVAFASSAVALSWLVFGFAADVPRRSPELAQWDRLIGETVGPGEVVASDQSWYVAWQADRPAVRFHGDARQLAELERSYIPIAALWLGRQAAMTFERTSGANGSAAGWRLASRGDDGTSLWVKDGVPTKPGRSGTR